MEDLVVDVAGWLARPWSLRFRRRSSVRTLQGALPALRTGPQPGPCACGDEKLDERWSRLKELDLGEGETP